MEEVLNTQITLSMIVGIMIKVLMFLLLIMTGVMTRQVKLMDRVIKLPVGANVKTLVWSVFILMIVLTVIVVLA